MKKLIFTSIMVALIATGTTLFSQEKPKEYLGLPGDNLNLYAVMRLFQESKTLEEFERNLNDPNSNINNLDLNGDNLVDYIKVIDNVDGDVHNIVLQDAISPVQNQDVAVFTVQRFQNGQVFIQLIGDEELYGKNYIIEPNYDAAGETPNPGYSGPERTVNVTVVRTSPVTIATWPLIRFVFAPGYTVWHSSWYWGYYPSAWHPWRPFAWDYYYGYHYNWDRYYYRYYRHTDVYRYDRWNTYYYHERRAFAPEIHHKIEAGDYRGTYNHPELRKEGEKMFIEKHPDQYRRINSSHLDNHGINQRTENQMTNRPVPSSDNRNSISRRQTGSMTDRPVNQPDTRINSVQKPSGTMTDRPGNQPNTRINSVQKPSGTMTDRPGNTARPSDNNTMTNRRTSVPNNQPSQIAQPGRSQVSGDRHVNTVTDRAIMNKPAEKNVNVNKVQNQTRKTDISPVKTNRPKEPEKKEGDRRN